MKTITSHRFRGLRAPSVCLSLIALTLLGAGCISDSFGHHRRTASSLMQYLYEGDTKKTVAPSVPRLTLPLRVGVAFVPDSTAKGGGGPSQLPESFKSELLDTVSAHFRTLPFVKSIETIPSAYLVHGGGFQNLDHLRQLFGVDVIALVSFDQVQNTDPSILSLTYWTIVGAYIVPGDRNTTTTMLDAAVFDIASRKLLFRAPGIDEHKGLSTAIGNSTALRGNSEASFKKASSQLTTNLQVELGRFQQRVKERPAEVEIVHSPGYTGSAGALGPLEIGTVAGVVLLVAATRRPRTS